MRNEYGSGKCDYCGARTWVEPRDRGTSQCRGCKVVAFFRWMYWHIGYELLAWQERELRSLYGTVDPATGLRRYRRGYIEIPKKNGKALALDTPIPTPSGWTAMGDLRVGDQVFDENGIPCNVVFVSDTFTDHECFEVEFSNGERVIADSGHRWLTTALCVTPGVRGPQKNRAEYTRVRTTKEIAESLSARSDGARNHSVAMPRALELPHTDLPIDPYVLGAWLGDGTSCRADVTCGDQDRDEMIAQLEGAGLSVKAVRSKSAWKLSLWRGDATLMRDLRALGTLNNKHIPAMYLRASLKQRLSLLQGLMDTDGFIDKTGKCIDFTTTSDPLARGVGELLATLGIKYRVSRKGLRCNGRDLDGESIKLQFHVFRDHLPVFRLGRKIGRMRLSTGNQMRPRSRTVQIVSVRSVATVPTRCISVDSPSHLFLCGRTMIPTHNTFLVGGLPIYHLTAEQVRKPEAYGAAATKEQAGLVFKAAVELIEANPVLLKRLRILKSVKRIIQRDGPGFYQVLSGDGKGTDGVEPSLILKDEVHRWSGAKAETLWEVLSKGTISREEPLEVMTTTAGSEDESLIWNDERDFAKSIISGEADVPSYYASIYQADEARVREEPDYWTTREARVAANPSHEDNGGFLKDVAILEELAKAQQKSGGINNYLRYHLGIKVSGTQENVIDVPRWIESTRAGDVDLRIVPEYDPEWLVRKWGLIEQPAFVGVDASWSIDLSAVSVVFPPVRDDIWRLLLFFFMPEAAIEERRKTDQVPYDVWVSRKFIDASPGRGIDYDRIKRRIRWACELFDVGKVAYDKWNFRATATDLENEGLPMREVPQNFSKLSEPTKTLLGAYLQERLWHGNNPVLLFNARSLALEYDRRDNVMPDKPKRLQSKKRIDGISATVTAMEPALVMMPEGPSPWAKAETAVM